MAIRVIFMGSPDFAIPALQALLDSEGFEVVGVVTQPDRPAGRGNKLTPPPIKVAAEKAGMPVFQPEKLRGQDVLNHLTAWQPDVFVVAAYGQILSQKFLDLPRYGSINVHASLLPRWRGAAPIQAAIRAGDAESGITIMKMDAGLDTGPMLLKKSVPLDKHETGQSLHDKLAALSGDLLIQALQGYISGDLVPEQQDDSLTTYAPMMTKEDGQIDWSQSALDIDRHVRAFYPWPGTYTFWQDKRLKIIGGKPFAGPVLLPGEVKTGNEKFPIFIGTARGVFAPTELQLAGKKKVEAAAFLNGFPGFIGKILG